MSHDSHRIFNSFNFEGKEIEQCLDCFMCSCHESDKLELPCAAKRVEAEKKAEEPPSE